MATQKRRKFVEKAISQHENVIFYKQVEEQQKAVAMTKCVPTWSVFENTYNWFRLKKTLTVKEQDQFQETWLNVYRKRKSDYRKTCR